MSILDWLYHRHYWGIPHKREGDNRMVQVCYECGKEREVDVDLNVKESLNEELNRGELGVDEKEEPDTIRSASHA